MLDADQILLITIYILVSSNIAMVDMYSHIQLILEFSTDNQRLSAQGYSVSSLEVSLESILHDEQDQIQNEVILEEEEENENGEMSTNNIDNFVQ